MFHAQVSHVQRRAERLLRGRVSAQRANPHPPLQQRRDVLQGQVPRDHSLHLVKPRHTPHLPRLQTITARRFVECHHQGQGTATTTARCRSSHRRTGARQRCRRQVVACRIQGARPLPRHMDSGVNADPISIK